MAPSLSRAIEEAMQQRSTATGVGSASDSFKLGCYEFDLVGLIQTNLVTGKKRQIRLIERQHDEWEVLQEAHGRLRLELATCKQAVASLETLRSEEAAKCSRMKAELKAAEETANETASQLRAVRDELRLSKEKEAEAEKSREALARELKRTQEKLGHAKEKAKDSSKDLKRSRQRVEALGCELGALRHSTAKDLDVMREELRLASDRAGQLRERCERADEAARGLASATQERDLALCAADSLRAEAALVAARDRATAFQAAVQLLLHARRPDAARLPCPAHPPAPGTGELTLNGLLGSFRSYVAEAFLETRAAHRRWLPPQEFCPKPDFEVLDVAALANANLAERFRLHVQQARCGEPARDHLARGVAKPPAALGLLSLPAGGCGGDGAWDETVLLAWHGASDEAVDGMLADGFRSVCVGTGAGSLFGKGIYFAENSSKADLYAGPRERRFRRHGGAMTVILSAVFCGNMYEATAAGRDWTQPPPPTEAQTKATGIRRREKARRRPHALSSLPPPPPSPPPPPLPPAANEWVDSDPHAQAETDPAQGAHRPHPAWLRSCPTKGPGRCGRKRRFRRFGRPRGPPSVRAPSPRRARNARPRRRRAACRFHSVLGQARARGGVVEHPEYVVFHEAQALPLAAVTYRHAAACRCARCVNEAP